MKAQLRTLAEVVAAVGGARLARGDGGTPIRGIAVDSRDVRPGDLFVAVPGATRDGRHFAAAAVTRGAAAVLTEGRVWVPDGTAVVEVPAARPAAAEAACAVYGHPSRSLTLVGVTGTDGKTTTTHLLRAALAAAGLRTGSISTLGTFSGGSLAPSESGLTTPEAHHLQRALAAMAGAGCAAAVVEVSSHALSLDRVRGCAFDGAVFTNLFPEHLEFHGSMEAYLAAKARLFAMAGESAFAVLNADSPVSGLLAPYCAGKVITYGIAERADVVARDIRLGVGGSAFTLVTPWGDARITTPLPGTMNVSNWLGAAAAALRAGAGLDAVVAAAAGTSVEGRMQRIDSGQRFEVVVDYAHTPHALATALRTLRAQTAGRLMVAFGHSGGRDAANRPALGSVAASLADVAVLTADNPRGEDPRDIAQQIMAGAAVTGGDAEVLVEVDRRTAIRELVGRAGPGDAILLAGKGHERHQLLGTATVPWSDAGEARAALTALGYRRQASVA
jgi:UDP-N-acetylmuramoyl-L-alanyl-D-glutamate--2,6-diaminopimelate ligase